MPNKPVMEICPVCKEGRSFKYIRKYHYLCEKYFLYECLKCRVQFWIPFVSPGPQWYDAQEQYRLKKPEVYRGYHKKFLELYPSFKAGTKVLEFGCGTGELLNEIQTRGAEVYGVDLGETNIHVAKQFFGLEKIYALSFEEFLKKPGLPEFDMVVFFETLEHLDKPLEFIQNIKKVLSSNGRIIMSVPSRRRMMADFYEWDFPPWHLSRWDKTAVSNLFENINFEIKAVYFTDQYIHFLELCAMFSEKILNLTELRGRLRGYVLHFFNLTRKYPAGVLTLIGKMANKKNGVMMIELERRK